MIPCDFPYPNWASELRVAVVGWLYKARFPQQCPTKTYGTKGYPYSNLSNLEDLERTPRGIAEVTLKEHRGSFGLSLERDPPLGSGDTLARPPTSAALAGKMGLAPGGGFVLSKLHSSCWARDPDLVSGDE